MRKFHSRTVLLSECGAINQFFYQSLLAGQKPNPVERDPDIETWLSSTLQADSSGLISDSSLLSQGENPGG